MHFKAGNLAILENACAFLEINQVPSIKFQINSKFEISMSETELQEKSIPHFSNLCFWSLDIVCIL
jgi:hypothetical protein